MPASSRPFIRALGAAIALVFVLPTTGAAKKSKEDDGEAKAVWRHPWAGPRYFDYTHEDWIQHDPRKEFDVFVERWDTTWELQEDGRVLYTFETELRVNEPDSLGPELYLDHISAARNTEIVELDASFVGGGRTDRLDESRLVQISNDKGRYIGGDRIAALLVPNDRPGVLEIRFSAISDPMEGLEEYFAGAVRIQPPGAAASRTVTLRVPEAQELVFHKRHFRLRPVESVADGVRTYRFAFETLGFPRWNSGMPHTLDALPVLFWSNQASWEALGALLSPVWEPHLVATESIQAGADATVSELDGEAAAAALHDWIAERIGYLGFYPGEAGWIPHDAAACDAARLGDCKDQAALMVAAMRSVGIDANPALIHSGKPFALPRVPVLLFNHAVVHVADPEHPDGGYLLDSVDSGTGGHRPGQRLAGRQALVLDPDGAFLFDVPMAEATHRLHEDLALLELLPDGAVRVVLEERWHGEEANERTSARRRADPATWERKIRERLATTYPGAVIESIDEGLDPDDPEVRQLRVVLTADGLLHRTGDLVVLELPWLERWTGRVPVQERRLHPRQMVGAWRRSEIRVRLPEGSSIAYQPEPGGDAREMMTSSLTTDLVDGELRVVLSVEWKPGRLSRKQEIVRRNFVDEIRLLQRRPIVLRLGAEGGAR
jgi:transglutaminase-like putative cysteine protease